MTVRIGEAARSGQSWGRRERCALECGPDGERLIARKSFPRHRLIWWFAPQPGRKPKR